MIDPICDLLYHIKYMFTGDQVKTEVEQVIRNLKPPLRLRLRFISHLSPQWFLISPFLKTTEIVGKCRNYHIFFLILYYFNICVQIEVTLSLIIKQFGVKLCLYHWWDLLCRGVWFIGGIFCFQLPAFFFFV
jgi:hypothetical protein